MQKSFLIKFIEISQKKMKGLLLPPVHLRKCRETDPAILFPYNPGIS
jgi:hypothetical protein